MRQIFGTSFVVLLCCSAAYGSLPLTRTETVAVSGSHTCAANADKTFWCWGYNSDGQLGTGDTNDRLYPAKISEFTGTEISGIFLTEKNSFVLTRDGAFWSWGDNSSGQLGTGDTNPRNTPTRLELPQGTIVTEATVIPSILHVTISTGSSSQSEAPTVCLRTTHPVTGQSIYCHGNLSFGRTTKFGKFEFQHAQPLLQEVPQGEIPRSMHFGYGMWGGLPYYNGGTTCISTISNQLYCKYFENQYQAGLGEPKNIRVIGLPPIPLKALRSVDNAIYALLEDGSVWTWTNKEGTVATLFEPLQGMTISKLEGDSWSVFAHTQDGRLFSWGISGTGTGNSKRESPTLVPLPGNLSLASIILNHKGSSAQACATFTDGTLACWGMSDKGQLGLGSRKTRYFPTVISAVATGAAFVTGVAVSPSGACATLQSGLLKCWGENTFGQLGNGTHNQQGDDPDEVFANIPFAEF